MGHLLELVGTIHLLFLYIVYSGFTSFTCSSSHLYGDVGIFKSFKDVYISYSIIHTKIY